MAIGRNNRMLQMVNSRMRVILCDNRTFIGNFAAYDKHMNLVLTDCTEYKNYRPRRSRELVEGKKKIGVAILRGENVTSIIVERSSR